MADNVEEAKELVQKRLETLITQGHAAIGAAINDRQFDAIPEIMKALQGAIISSRSIEMLLGEGMTSPENPLDKFFGGGSY